MVSTMPNAVNGLTKHEAASAAEVPSFISRQAFALTQRYSEYIDPPAKPTILPIRCSASFPASTTVPEPSLPTGKD